MGNSLSTVVLVVTVVSAIVGIGAIVLLYLANQRRRPSTVSPLPVPLTRIQLRKRGISTCSEDCSSLALNSTPQPLLSLPYTIPKGEEGNSPLPSAPPSLPWLESRVRPPYFLSKPIPTNSWVQNSLYRGGFSALYCYPYHCLVSERGVTVTYSPPEEALWSGLEQGPMVEPESSPYSVLLSACSLPKGWQCRHIDPFVAHYAWSGENQLPEVVVPLCRGSVFVTVLYRDSLPTISSTGDKLWTLEEEPGEHSVMHLRNDSLPYYFLLLAEPPIHLHYQHGDWTCQREYTGTLQLALITEEGQEQEIRRNAGIYPVAGEVVTGESKTVYSWKCNRGDALLWAPPHQARHLPCTGHVCPLALRGPAHLTRGNRWTIPVSVSVPGFFFPSGNRELTRLHLESTVKAWYRDVRYLLELPFPPDTIGRGRRVMLLSQLLLVGEQLALPSEGEEFSSAVSRIKEELSLFSSALAYDPSWGGVVHIRGRCDCQGESDEGNPYYRGHHWQYGYYLYAYAVLGRYDLPWLQKQDTPLLLVRDIANPSANDPWFPYSRHKDWFFGGSIGNGLSPLQYKGREYSRIGETINAYYAVHLLSGLLGYSSLRTHAECLLDSEMEGLRHYHQLRGGVTVSSAESQDPVVWEWSDSGYRYPPIGMLKALAEIVLPASPISRSILSREWVETLLLSLPTELREEPLSQLLRMRCGEDLFSLLVQEEPREDLPPTLLLHWLLTEE